jgi:phosphopantothenoylcysteine synthetase/decarboxylase
MRPPHLPVMKFLITAGPTREPLDPVRYLSNRSSGKMGYALAAAAITAGHEVCLISGPVSLQPPASAACIQVETASQMFQAVKQHIHTQHVAIFSAAVADYRPAHVHPQKIKKNGADCMTLQLERTEDILGSARSVFGFTGYLVGFAAETVDLIPYAQEKLRRKDCDLIIANDVSSPGIGFDSAENAVTLCPRSGVPIHLPRALKTELATELIRYITAQIYPKITL